MTPGLIFFEFLIYMVPLLSVAFFVIGVVFITNKTLNFFSLTMFASSIYSLGYFLERMSGDLTTALAGRNISYLGGVFIPSFALLFVLRITKPEKIKASLITFLCFLSSSLWLIFLADPIHGLFFSGMEFSSDGRIATLNTTMGPLYILLMTYYMAFTVITGALIWKKAMEAKRPNTKRSYKLLFGTILVPWVVIPGVLFVYDAVDPVPFTIMLVVFLIGVNEVNHGIFRAFLGTWQNAHKDLDMPCLLMDENHKVILSNKSFMGLSKDTAEKIRKKASGMIENNEYRGEIILESKPRKLYFEITQSIYDIRKKIYSVFISDVSDIKSHLERIEYLSFFDPLTDLHNRRYFARELKNLDCPDNYPISIALIDVNGLKLTNDAFGHDTGDELLKTIAGVLKEGFSEDQVLARYGGDEFIAILPSTRLAETDRILDKLRKEVATKKIKGISISIAAGAAQKDNPSQDINTIIKIAENKMYRNKIYEDLSIRSKMIGFIMKTLNEKNKREMEHSERVGEIAERIALYMGLSEGEARQIKLAGRMHDIGKIGIDEDILNDPDIHTREKKMEMRKHTEIGYRLLSSVNEFSSIARYVLEHHERWDGKGYPKGLKGEQISLESRIISVADTFDALTNERPYRKVLSFSDAIIEITNNSGKQFDPRVIDAIQSMSPKHLNVK